MNKSLRRFLLLLLLCFTLPSLAQLTNVIENMYKVKKKDTMFSIAKKNGITVEELIEANPEMKNADYVLKKGEFIFIPKAGKKTTSGKASSSATSRTSQQPSKAIGVGIMLPLHNVDGDGRRMVEYYRGFLMGCDSLRSMGMSLNIYAWNVDIDTDISKITRDPNAAKCHIIFGPLYTHQVRGLAEFCKAYHIKMVIPFSITGDDVARYKQIFQVWQTPDKLNNSAIDAFVRHFPDAHPVFIDCNDSTSKKGLFTFGLRNRLENLNRTYNITNLNSSEAMFGKAFSRTKPNVVILNTGRSPELTVAIEKLHSLKNNNPGIRISLFGYTEWLMYTGIRLDDFFAFDTYIPSTFYYNEFGTTTRQMEERYRRSFHADMQSALPRFALVGYDHAQFFLRGLNAYGDNFKGTKGQSTYVPLQTPLVFKQVGTAGMQNQNFQLIHYRTDRRIESITY